MKKIGRYEIQEALGEGRFGAVFRGFDPILDRPAAVKVVREPASADTSRGEETRVDPADDATLIALQQEIEAGARVEICARDDADGHMIVRRIP